MSQYILIGMFTLSIILNAQAETVDSARADRIVKQSAQATTAFLGSGAKPYLLNLPEIQADLTAPRPGVQKTGVVYQLPSPLTSSELTWEPVNGGFVARIHLVSVQAKRLRFHLVFNQAISSIGFRLQGSENVSLLPPINQTFIHDKNIWLPITKGNSADLEIFLNNPNAADASLNIDAVNIIIDDQSSANSIPATANTSINNANVSKAQSLFLAQLPQYDLACWDNATEYPALQDAAASTAQISFIDNGGSFVCTGTLLNDRRTTFTPWFVTANHCITNQAVANSAAFEWFHQAPACGDSFTDSRYAITFGGGRLLWRDPKQDVSFMRLNELPPIDAIYSGWNSKPLKLRNRVWGVHHPSGDHTMVNFGNVLKLSQKIKGSDGKSHNLNVVRFLAGATESGSSGSGLFDTTNGAAHWRGTLFGGSIVDDQISDYTIFSNYYPKIKRWLDGSKRRR